jgi:ribosomal protein L7/L12
VLIALVFIVAVVFVLMEFHRRLRVVEDRLARLEQAGPNASPGGSEPSAEVKVLAESGHKIEAMRLYRQQSGADLRAAKEVVERLSEHGPGRA